MHITIKFFKKKVKKKKYKTHKLEGCPQKKGTCILVHLLTPKKPNSALRRVARVKLTNDYKLTAHIPGCGHNLQKHSTVLVRGGRARDLPAVRYKLVRGKYDLERVVGRMQGRSKFGTKKVWK